ncbi:hypothetical protein Pcac1_g20335 [Phytophthora cactorum]|uniref:Uncharacterized protein n=1 Tax=Phytophthora cactorum TaxID=29920 RepID=A0A329RF63_9STRA|nr:hypothetical protein Pcac1_g20335 [Phytophthora cactorum]KAG2813909.1 hypothetical protein PC112_g14535 [Phytophthora cactorum]KAG2817044.1 hypothetical protein PC111_g12873 [Phytophthora cactorum]KAG2922132.1 hypothetical protein PC117_g16039 [Phytophthora cactorum]KAG3001910.1 hypothetical protein PC119_g16545 [Phytophthora cactorum]
MVAESIALSIRFRTNALSMIHGSLQKKARAALQNSSELRDDELEPAAGYVRETGEGPSDSPEKEETAPSVEQPRPVAKYSTSKRSSNIESDAQREKKKERRLANEIRRLG